MFTQYPRTCSAAGLSRMTSAACLSALQPITARYRGSRDAVSTNEVPHLLALCSPSAAITLARALRAASASAAMARISCSGTRTSLT